jgi:allophanate hydrolase subunit 2
MRGPQADYFDDAAFDRLQRSRFVISPQSNRMGYRLSGERIRVTFTGDMISDAAFTGAIQVPPSGDPILLMVDRQTTGGYPQIAVLISADMSVAGQLLPGDWIEFELCTRADAIAALREQRYSNRID